MSLRKKLEKSKNIVVPIVVVAAVAVLAFAWKNSGTGHGGTVESAWVYNLDTGELTARPTRDAVGPIKLDDGVGYRAYVYSCGTCGEPERKVAYLVKYTKEAADNSPHPIPVPADPGTEFVASLEQAQNNQWVPGNLSSKSKLMQAATGSCTDSFTHCFP